RIMAFEQEKRDFGPWNQAKQPWKITPLTILMYCRTWMIDQVFQVGTWMLLDEAFFKHVLGYAIVQDYALWEVIENGNSWVSVPQTAQENGTYRLVRKMSVPVTAKGKTNKKNDVKARSLLLIALPNEHQLTFSNEATKKTQKTLLKQQYENFSASSTKSLDSIFNRLQRFLPPEWNNHIVVWINKAEIETMSIDDFTSSTNDVNTTKPAYEVSTVSPNVNIASPQDLEQIHEDDPEAMDLKWQLSLLSMRAKRYYQRTCKKIFINANDTARYDKSKVECFNCHKMRHFSRECRAPRNKEGQFRNQDNTRKQGNNEDTSLKVMLAIDGVGFNKSDMIEEQV
ncbi:ribonuclease H-like domain-containing protein, partial [Tanacetum coccineum]